MAESKKIVLEGFDFHPYDPNEPSARECFELCFPHPESAELKDYFFCGFPVDEAARVKVMMAYVNHKVAVFCSQNGTALTDIVPNGGNRIYISEKNSQFSREMWTAYMIFGQKSSKRFGHEAISFEGYSLSWEERKKLIDEETGLFSGFSRNSLYETMFKKHITPGMLVLSASVALYDDIPASTDPKQQIQLKKAKLIENYNKKLKDEQQKQAIAASEREKLAAEKRASAQALEERKREEIRKAEEARKTNPVLQAAYERQEEAKRAQEARIAEELKQQQLRKQAEYERQQQAVKAEQARIAEELKQQELKKQIEATKQSGQALIHKINQECPSLLDIGKRLRAANLINFQDEEGNTLLMHAIACQKEYIAIYLLNTGADPRIRNHCYESAYNLIAPNTFLYECLKESEKKIQFSKMTSEFRYSQLLLEEASNPQAQVQKIDEYLKNKADVNCKNDNGYTPVMLAIDAGNDRVVEYLFNMGANPLEKNNYDKTAKDLVSRTSATYSLIKGYELLYFTQIGDLDAIRILLNTDNSTIDFQGKNGYTALLIAVEQNQSNLVEYLLTEGANLSITCDDGIGVFDLSKDSFIQTLLREHAASYFEDISDRSTYSPPSGVFYRDESEGDDGPRIN